MPDIRKMEPRSINP